MSFHNLYEMENDLVIYTSSKQIGDLCKELGGKFLLLVSGDKLKYGSQEEHWDHNENGFHLIAGKNSPWKFMSGREARKMLNVLMDIKKADHADLPLLINIADTCRIKSVFQKEYITTVLSKRLKENSNE